MPTNTRQPARNNPPGRKRKRVTKRQAYRRRMTALAILIIIIILFFRTCAVSCNKIRSSPTASTIEKTTTSTTNTSIDDENPNTDNNLITSIEDNNNDNIVKPELDINNSSREYLIDRMPDAHRIDMEVILQNPELPTGCEVTSLTMVLNYLGFDVTKTELVDGYLTCKNPGTATFREAFIGSPYDSSSYGCFAPVIIDTAEKYIKANNSGRIVKNLTGSDFDFLLKEVASGHPVIVWTSISQVDVHEEYAFTIYNENIDDEEITDSDDLISRNDLNENYDFSSSDDAKILYDQSEYVFDDDKSLNNSEFEEHLEHGSENGKDVYWIVNEHCVVLMGYDSVNNNVIVADPLEGEVVYDMNRFKKLYYDLYKQAVIIY